MGASFSSDVWWRCSGLAPTIYSSFLCFYFSLSLIFSIFMPNFFMYSFKGFIFWISKLVIIFLITIFNNNYSSKSQNWYPINYRMESKIINTWDNAKWKKYLKKKKQWKCNIRGWDWENQNFRRKKIVKWVSMNREWIGNEYDVLVFLLLMFNHLFDQRSGLDIFFQQKKFE